MSWFSELFSGGKNPAESAMPYVNQIPGQASPYLNPYFQAGTSALPSLQDQYSKLLSDPGGMVNKIGSSFQKSPGFDFALKQALQAGNNAAAAGGMAGTPQHQFQAQETATGLANQEYNNYLQNALGLYGGGLSGQQGMAGMGQQAGQSLSDLISQSLAQQGAYAYQGQAAQNQNRNNFFGNILGGLGAFPFIGQAYRDFFHGGSQ